MTQTLELAEFTVREGEEAALVAERPEMIRALQRAFPAALAAWLTKQDDGSWLDVILWRNREAADLLVGGFKVEGLEETVHVAD